MLAAGFDALAVVCLEVGLGFGLLDGGSAVAGSFRRGEVAEDRPLEALRQIELPLRVGALRQRLGRGKAEVGEHGAHMLRRGPRAAGIAH